MSSLIAKYNVPGPRYTSYPTVPFWNTADFNRYDWQQRLTSAFATSNYTAGISLYIHLPYCESLCTFCGCNKRITRNHGVEEPYVGALLDEWAMYCEWLPERPRLAELHLGGGTPSFFSTHQLRRLLMGIFRYADVVDEPDFGWEGHPNNTSYDHLKTLYEFGFRRVSFGVQDYDLVVQQAIHRHQPFANVRRVTEQAREIGYTSISHDLVFGLPFQQVSSIQDTVKQTLSLRPDRISFYSYAHVPWIKGNGQRGFRDEDLPNGDQKRDLYETGRALFEAGGYTEIGMDHFALPHDSLRKAMKAGTLHRNFMGYTTTRTDVIIGLGASSISDVGTAFMQNEKSIDTYLTEIEANQLPILRGHLLTDDDVKIRQLILDIMCRFQTSWSITDWTGEEWALLTSQLDDLRDDGLLDYDTTGLRVRSEGRPFLRNICMVFDRYLTSSPVLATPVFSQTV
ncbi:oxygen-independent coproporphyrinogen III oxidase [Fibrella forsythiae]|uniref:Coproporphyrinogen-III oxidase n=1 Tax=Fibrella forsythiae TaxID=2817061 RepID=A0ABS3JHF6_9BACT|nr:oxygen-independent coproporphyrinogen III oxidase [Fibrella forsythiae]MBO0949433.1 oxygen-independent coproporphyrinogen III oxidase [Fibrella forsythiae]